MYVKNECYTKGLSFKAAWLINYAELAVNFVVLLYTILLR